MSKIQDIVDKSALYEDTVKRTEIRNTLRMLFRQVGSLSGEQLDLLKRHIDKLVKF